MGRFVDVVKEHRPFHRRHRFGAKERPAHIQNGRFATHEEVLPIEAQHGATPVLRAVNQDPRFGRGENHPARRPFRLENDVRDELPPVVREVFLRFRREFREFIELPEIDVHRQGVFVVLVPLQDTFRRIEHPKHGVARGAVRGLVPEGAEKRQRHPIVPHGAHGLHRVERGNAQRLHHPANRLAGGVQAFGRVRFGTDLFEFGETLTRFEAQRVPGSEEALRLSALFRLRGAFRRLRLFLLPRVELRFQGRAQAFREEVGAVKLVFVLNTVPFHGGLRPSMARAQGGARKATRNDGGHLDIGFGVQRVNAVCVVFGLFEDTFDIVASLTALLLGPA